MSNAVQLAQYGSNNVGLAFKNRIINGAMVIDQRNAGASVTANDGVFPVDRFKFSMSQSSKGTGQRSTTAPTGFINSLLFTSSSAYSVLSTDNFNIRHVIEGYNGADLGFGTASAKTVTVSFLVQSSLTGTFGGALGNQAWTRSYPFTYTISSANTWTSVSVTIAGDTTGTWNTDNNGGLNLWFGLGVGSTKSGTAGAWAAADYRSATGATSVVGTNGATFYITGVQLEKGSNATSFDYVNYQTSLANCKRYYDQQKSTSLRMYLSDGNDGTDDLYRQLSVFFKEEMRTAPTVTFSATLTGATLNGTSTFGTTATSTCLQTQGSDTSHFAAVTGWTASAEL